MGILGTISRFILGGIVVARGVLLLLTGLSFLVAGLPLAGMGLGVLAFLGKLGAIAGIIISAIALGIIAVGLMAMAGNKTAIMLIGLGLVLLSGFALLEVLLWGIVSANLLWYGILMALFLASVLL